jgi:hypothetical protein
MTFNRFLGRAALVLGVALASAQASAPAFAAKPAVKAGKKGAAPAVQIKELAKPVLLAPKGLEWGMSLAGIAKVYDGVFDREMLPKLKKAEKEGLRYEFEALENQLEDMKGILRRKSARVEFDTPTGVDYSALKGEYSYKNSESMANLTLRSGTERHFFFFNDRLWKIYDEHKLKKGSALGTTYEEAIKNISKRFGGPPTKFAANPAAGRNFDEAVWRDSKSMIRALNRGGTLAMVYADKSVQDNLARFRTNKAEDIHKLDADVLAVTKAEEPAKPADAAAAAKKKKTSAPPPEENEDE